MKINNNMAAYTPQKSGKVQAKKGEVKDQVTLGSSNDNFDVLSKDLKSLSETSAPFVAGMLGAGSGALMTAPVSAPLLIGGGLMTWLGSGWVSGVGIGAMVVGGGVMAASAVPMGLGLYAMAKHG